MATQFTFTLDSFQITDTRSLHKDTDYVSFTLVVNPQGGKGKPQTLKKSMGDLNNGTFPVNLSFPNITVDPTDMVKLNYLIVNSGHKSPSEVESALETVGTSLLTAAGTKGVDLLGDLIGVPFLGTALGPLIKWLPGELSSIINANCDGAVAAEQNTFKYADLLARTANGPFNQHTEHPGTTSPAGCGRNSTYYVNWHIIQIGNPNNKTVPDVVGMATDTPGPHPVHQNAVATLQAAGLKAAWEQGTKGALVVRQSPPADSVVDVGSAVTLWRGTVAP
jgi:hypothetical protein